MTRRHTLALAALPLLAACSRDPARGTGLVGTEPGQLRVVWTESPQTDALVAWSTAEAGTTHEVRWGATSSADDPTGYPRRLVAQESGAYESRLPEGEPTGYFHHARLDGLEPSTTYWFVVASDDAVSREFHLVTAPADDRVFTILSGSDSRTDRHGRRRMNRELARMLAEDDEVIALWHGGDYEWDGSLYGDFSIWLNDHQLTTTDAGRVLPILPCRGNHEQLGILYDQVFGFPGAGTRKNWYATRIGTRVELITLDDNQPAGGEQLGFLRETLEKSREVPFHVVSYHRPIYPSVKKPSDTAPFWAPVFDEFGVELVLESDGHTLKRTLPIVGGAPAADGAGTVYLGEGGLGVRQRSPRTDRWFLQPPGFATSARHIWKLRFTADAIEARAVGEGGEVLDRADIAPLR